MKNLKTKTIAISIVMAAFSISAFGQVASQPTTTVTKKQVKLEKTKVPTAVTETYFKEYPVTTYENWYGYPTLAEQEDWYNYDQNMCSNRDPEYYVVEFTKESVPHKVVYNKTGKKIATHKRLTSEIPKAVSEAINKGDYKSWKLLREKEEIFKDSESDEMKVYKVEVEHGKEKHALFYLANGNLLKDKKLAS